MSELQFVAAQLVKVSVLALLVAMAMRGRLGLCWSFTLYLVAILVCNSLVTLWPGRFYTPAFWVLKQAVYDLLKMAVGVELAWRAFSMFPGAWRIARVVLVALLTASTLALTWLTPRSSYLTLWEWQPGVVTATVWLLTAIALLVVLYQIPIGEWQRAIVLGFAPYLVVFISLLSVLQRRGWKASAEIGLLDSFAYLALLLFWVRAAWRLEQQPAAEAEPARSFA